MKKLLLVVAALLVAATNVSAQVYGTTQTFDGKYVPDFKQLSFFPSTGGIVGTLTNDAASAGIVGELISSTIASASAVGLTNNTLANMTSVTLTPGDWDVTCTAAHKLAGTTTVTSLEVGLSATTATLPTVTGGTSDYIAWRQASAAPGGDIIHVVGPHRVSVAANTTYFCVFRDNFGTSTDAAYGTLRARRVR